jgi:MFS family permease
MDRSPLAFSAYWSLLRDNRNFRLLWSAQIVSELGDWLYSIAIYSLLLELTGSATSVAIAVVLQELPQFFVAPAAGVVNDRMSRKRVMILADVARAVIMLLMLWVQARQWVGMIYVLLFVETMMWA